MTNFQNLTKLGFTPFFQRQMTLEEWESSIPARVTEQHKSLVKLMSDTSEIQINLMPSMPDLVVGDWVLLDKESKFLRLLDRSSCFKRKSAGSAVDWQLISSNVDTAFIVCSMNEDFNLNRIERYLSLAYSAETEPVIVLTKSDLVTDTEEWIAQIHAIDNNLAVVPINALDEDCLSQLSAWLNIGKTIVLLGSSGVGKSTLTNTLLGIDQQQTGQIREGDDKGKHTTSFRSLVVLPSGGVVLDNPGMRELQLADCHDGIASAFSDIEALSVECRFVDCRHDGEPNCAVQAAVQRGDLSSRRLENFQKLLREEAFNSRTLAARRANEKSFSKFVKNTVKETQKFKGRS